MSSRELKEGCGHTGYMVGHARKGAEDRGHEMLLRTGEPAPDGRGVPVGWLEWPNEEMAKVKRQLGKALALRVTRKACQRSVERVLNGLCAVQASQVSRLVSTGAGNDRYASRAGRHVPAKADMTAVRTRCPRMPRHR